MPAKKNGLNWKEIGQFVATLVKLFTDISNTFRQMKVGGELIEWLIGDGKEFFEGKLKEIGAEFQRWTAAPQKAPTGVKIWGRDVYPELPSEDWTVAKHLSLGETVKFEKREDGCLYVNGKKVVLYRSQFQRQGFAINAHDFHEEFGNRLVSASILDFLMCPRSPNNKEFIPEEWKNHVTHICFLGTVFSSDRWHHYVRCGHWCGESLHYTSEPIHNGLDPSYWIAMYEEID